MSRLLKVGLLDNLQKNKKYHSTTWPFQSDQIESWAYANNVFTPTQCETIIKIGKNANLQEAYTSMSPVYDKSIRNSNVSWLSPDQGNEWIFQKMTDVVLSLNSQYFKFDLWGFAEGIQFTEYTSPGGKYNPHIDCMYKGRIRKLSISVQLSDPNDYEGGDFTINTGNEIILPREQGIGLVFPSYVLHGVKPVTSGTRYSLVAWVTGPVFK